MAITKSAYWQQPNFAITLNEGHNCISKSIVIKNVDSINHNISVVIDSSIIGHYVLKVNETLHIDEPIVIAANIMVIYEEAAVSFPGMYATVHYMVDYENRTRRVYANLDTNKYQITGGTRHIIANLIFYNMDSVPHKFSFYKWYNILGSDVYAEMKSVILKPRESAHFNTPIVFNGDFPIPEPGWAADIDGAYVSGNSHMHVSILDEELPTS